MIARFALTVAGVTVVLFVLGLFLLSLTEP